MSQSWTFGSFRLPDLAIKPWDKGHCDTFYVINGRIIDPARGEVIDGRVIKVEKGKIVSIDGTAPPNATTYDAGGNYICPGLIDAHVHVTAVPGVAVGQ